VANTYIIGQVVLLRDRISDPSTGDIDDPATQTPVDDPTEQFTVYKPDRTSLTLGATHGTTGVYTAQILADTPGWWEYVGISTGAGAGAGRNRFYVSQVP
jgi:hypothetical protein